MILTLETPADTLREWLYRIAGENPDIFGRGGRWKISAEFEPQMASHDSRICLIDDKKVHVKFFRRVRGRTGTVYDPIREMRSEYSSLKVFDRHGFSTGRYRVVRALGINEKADCALATLYVDGPSVLEIITGVVGDRRSGAELCMSMELVAGLLKKIHTELPGSAHIDQCELFYSFFKSLVYLEELNALEGSHRKVMKSLAEWYDCQPLFLQPGVTIHGDANPSNFKIDAGVIYGYDMERSRPDRSACVDLGAMIADLGHQFMRAGRKADDAKPYIGHFLKAYGAEKKDGLAKILPFFIAHGYLKIAMLGYWDYKYRQKLVAEGMKWLEEGP